MKFIRKEKIITTIIDEEISEVKEQEIIFNNLCNSKIKCSITIKQPHYDGDYTTIEFPSAIITKVNDNNTLDLFVFKKSGTMKIRGTSFNDIKEIKAITIKNSIYTPNSDITRFELLDL